MKEQLTMQQLMHEQAMGEKEIKRREVEKKIFFTEFTANQLICYYYFLG
jgi:hypothetical protein